MPTVASPMADVIHWDRKFPKKLGQDQVVRALCELISHETMTPFTSRFFGTGVAYRKPKVRLLRPMKINKTMAFPQKNATGKSEKNIVVTCKGSSSP